MKFGRARKSAVKVSVNFAARRQTAKLRRDRRSPHTRTLLARCDNEILGQALLKPSRYLSPFYVSKGARKSSLGSTQCRPAAVASSPYTMPTAKRVKRGRAAVRTEPEAPSEAQNNTEPLPTAEAQDESPFAKVARKNWLKPSKRATTVKVKKDVVKGELWDTLEKENFQYKSLSALENLQTLERYGALSCHRWAIHTDFSTATSGLAMTTNPQTTTSS